MKTKNKSGAAGGERGDGESIEWFIEDQASRRRHMIWLLPHPLPPFSLASCISFSAFMCVAGRAGRGGRAKSYDGEKAWSSINHSILSGAEAALSSCPTPNSEIWNLAGKFSSFVGPWKCTNYTPSNQRVEIILFFFYLIRCIRTKMGWGGGGERVNKMQLQNSADHFGNVIKRGIIKRGCSSWGCC